MTKYLASKLNIVEGNKISIYGWINSTSIFGKLLFIRLWNKNEIIQIVLREQNCKAKKEKLELSWKEFIGLCTKGTVLFVKGIFQNNEIVAKSVEIISECEITIDTLFSESSKLSNRIPYLRNTNSIARMKLQSDFLGYAKQFFSKKDFIEVFTPILSQNTAEGAKVFKIIGEKSEYVLCQSPQIYKQSLMCAGFDKYFQIAPCFRDEDLRNDRQPEFHQLDIEMSFCKISDIQKIFQKLILGFIKKYKLTAKTTFERKSFAECMEKYGTDKPDIRCEEDIMVTDNFCSFCIEEANFEDMKDMLQSGEIGYAFYDNDKVISNNIVLDEKIIKTARTKLQKRFLLIINSSSEAACNILFKARKYVLRCEEYKFIWIDNIPMFEEKDNKLEVRHNPFCDTKNSKFLFSNNIKDILKTPSSSFDLVLNGVEILGGSIREKNYKRQSRVFDVLKMPKEQQQTFDFFIKMLQSGVPIHGGAALGIERFLCSISFENSIREFIAFPKSSTGRCLFFSNIRDNIN